MKEYLIFEDKASIYNRLFKTYFLVFKLIQTTENLILSFMRSCGYFEFKKKKLIQMWELFLRDSVLIQTWELFYLFWIMKFFFFINWTVEDRMLIFWNMRCV